MRLRNWSSDSAQNAGWDREGHISCKPKSHRSREELRSDQERGTRTDNCSTEVPSIRVRLLIQAYDGSRAQTEDVVIAKIEPDVIAVQNAVLKALSVIRVAIEEEPRKDKKISQVIRIASVEATARKTFGNDKDEDVARGCVYWTNINRESKKLYATVANARQDSSEFLGYRDGSSAKGFTRLCRTTESEDISCGVGRMFKVFRNNGKQFTATEFQEFCKKQGIEQTHSPPFYPQSNGQAEGFVDTLKRTIQYIKEGGTTGKLAEFLQCYR
ncbi:hypothetical protein OESDEN_05395 [Oesophagostomum dentatum]|uniref:Integrase catalytic domain-containing protein n=1 Tax=Oesophagostomum dentatum TaxID=61180 RepID=A0A0B1TAW3_OESDE|nr:hypothetical protein OESDEN_05395 [Oesophagostomum dentatum]